VRRFAGEAFMFIRIFKNDKRTEVLYNTDHIRKIEVIQGQMGENQFCPVSLDVAAADPECKRWYRIYIGEDEINLVANPGNKVVDVIEAIYKNAVKNG
jgi:hypothetical protein